MVCVQCQSSYNVSLTPKKAGQNFMVERQRCSYLLYIFYIPDRCLDPRNGVDPKIYLQCIFGNVQKKTEGGTLLGKSFLEKTFDFVDVGFLHRCLTDG